MNTDLVPMAQGPSSADPILERRVREVLADSERHFRELVEYSSDLIAVVSAEGLLEYVSPSVRRLLGHEPRDVFGRSTLDFLHPNDAAPLFEALRHALTKPPEPTPTSLRFRHADGSWRLFESVGRVCEVRPGVNALIVNARDVTERSAAEERQQALMGELREARLAADVATRAKSAFVANMSHELRTPLNAVLGLTEILLDGELTEEQRRYLTMVREAGDILLALLNDILDLSKIEADRLELEAIPVDLTDLVHTTARLFAVAAFARGLELVVDIDPAVPSNVRCDPTRLRQILVNLIGNAVKFTNQGEVTVAVTLVGRTEDLTAVHFSVRDTGIGIPPDKLARIFDPFGQVDASTTRRYGGTGLGLAIARRLARLMGGDLSVASALGQGSEFSFTLAMALDTESVLPAPETRARLDGVLVLVVDDNESARRVLCKRLASSGATAHAVADADAALAALTSALEAGRPFAAVVLDSQLPDTASCELVAAIQWHPGLTLTPVVLLSPGNRPTDTDDCRQPGIAACLTKPASRKDLEDAIAGALAATAPAAARAHRAPVHEALSPRRILLAEDNRVNQEVAVAMLRKRGHTVTVADNGALAVAAFVDGAYDLVLMDIHMPEMDGFSATQAIRRLPGGQDIPIIALTADALTGEREHCLAAGMDDYLSKPFVSRDLFAIVERRREPREKSTEVATIPASTATVEIGPAPVDLDGFRAAMREAGAEAAVDGILATFVATAPASAAALEAALRTGSAPAIASAAHAFKSAAGAIGARPLAEILLAIESAAKRTQVDQAVKIAADVPPLVDSALAFLRQAGHEE
jgi:PAS domain S-box-containing protein